MRTLPAILQDRSYNFPIRAFRTPAGRWPPGTPGVMRTPNIRPDRSGADFREASLFEVNLRGANLAGALLASAGLTGADLSEANLSEANLRKADLSGVDLPNA